MAIPAAAQTLDTAPAPAAGGPVVGIPNVAPVGGSAKVLLHDNGTYITQTGVGFGGADVSEIEGGLTLYGWGHQFTLLNRIADDFNVPAATTWNLSNLRWLAYQTGAPTTGTITGIYTEYVAGATPNGAVIAGDQVTNRLLSTTWTGVYRVTSGTITNSQRALIEVNANAAFVPALATGQYWVLVMCDGTLTSGPWCPPTVLWDAADNNQQSISGAAFVPTTQGQGGAPGDSVYWLDGTTGGGGGATPYCSQSKPTTVPGCTATLSATDLTLATGTWDTANVPMGPSSGGSSIGIFIYQNGVGVTQSTFSATVPFGTLCLNPFLRSSPTCPAPTISGAPLGCFAPGFASFSPNCNGGALGINVGDGLNVQFWYRDPGAGGNANFTNAIFYNVL